MISSLFGRIVRSWTTPNPKVSSRIIASIDAEVDMMDELGSGRFGVVRVGNRKAFPNERIAIKCVPKSRATLRELKNEIRCLSKVSGHRNVMNMIDAFEDKTHAYILTPLYTGGELFDRIVTQRSFTEMDAAKCMTNLLSAVAHCHSRSIVHRDVKPENLLYASSDPGAELVLVDFGMSREFEIGSGDSMDLQCGSPSYVAPEVLQRNYNEKCDVWSCGIILHILLVGRTPFGNGTDDEILDHVEKFDSLCLDDEDWNDISTEAKELVLKLLEKDPKKRISPTEALEHRWITDTESIVLYRDSTLLLANALENIKHFNKSRRLKKAAIRVIAELAREEETAKRIAHVMASLERDEQGNIRLADLAHIIPNLSANTNIQGVVDPKDLLASAITASIQLDEQYLLAAFRRFDVDADGQIDKNELANALGKDPKVDREFVMEVMREADTDGNGYITFEEFASVVGEKSSSPEQVRRRETTLKFDAR